MLDGTDEREVGLSAAADGNDAVVLPEDVAQNDPRLADAARRKRELEFAATRIDELLVDQQVARQAVGARNVLQPDVDE